MLTLIITITFLGFFILYHTSKKVQLNRSLFIEKWTRDHRRQAKYLAYALLLLALLIIIPIFGVGSGIFGYIVILMTVASITILLAPLRYLSFGSLTVIFTVSIITEIIFT